jgi:DNA-binding GntR family transcriptional regulator
MGNPLPPATKKDHIADELRRLVRQGQLKRGARIRQDEIAQRFDVSITPVREALRQLEAEGLLVSEPNKGVRVAPIDLEQLKGIYVARRLLEPYATQRASLRLSRRDLAELRRATAEMEAAASARKDVPLRDANRRFHFLLYERSGLVGLTSVIETLWTATPWDVVLATPWDAVQIVQDRRAISVAEHTTIIEAIEGGDLEEIRAAADRHIANSYVAISSASGAVDAASSPDPFDFDVD